MKKFFAIQFNVVDGIAIAYSVLSYDHYLKDIKNKGYKPHLTSFTSQQEAELTANGFVGVDNLETALQARNQDITDDNEAEAAQLALDDSAANDGTQQSA